MILSFPGTIDDVLAGKMTETNAVMTIERARQYRKGDLVSAFDNDPKQGGKRVAYIKLTAGPRLIKTIFLDSGLYRFEFELHKKL